MKTTDTMPTSSAADRKGGILYPTLLIAAIAVIVFSVLGIAAMTGYMPSALSKNGPDARSEAATENAPAKKPGNSSLAADGGAGCADCGVVESTRAVESKGRGSGLGAAAGGVVGGLLGNQIGGWSGRTAMTVVGAGAGAYAGHEIERNVNKSVSYQVRVRMNTHRTFYETDHLNGQYGAWRRMTRLPVLLGIGVLLAGCDPVSLTVFGVGAASGVQHTLDGISSGMSTLPSAAP